MNDEHAQLLAELRQLAEDALNRIEPVVARMAAGEKAQGGEAAEYTGCHWCPVCALAALVRGEKHELLTALSEHSLAIVTLVRQALADPSAAAASAASASSCPDDGEGQGDSVAAAPPGHSGAFVAIPVTIHP